VKVATPTFISRSTKQFSIVVDAKYVFGKPLKGTMTLKITPVFKTKNSWSKVSKPHIIISDINGKYVADVHNHDLIIPRNHTHNAILVETLVEEKTTAVTGQGKDKIIVVESEKNRTKFEIQITNFRFLLPGAHFFTTIHVKSKNGQPIPSKNSFVKFQSTFELIDHSKNVTMQTFKLDANGKVDVKIDVPIMPTRSLKLDVSIQGILGRAKVTFFLNQILGQISFCPRRSPNKSKTSSCTSCNSEVSILSHWSFILRLKLIQSNLGPS
jgi:hypothetical protein